MECSKITLWTEWTVGLFDLARGHLGDFTLVRGDGCWKGEREDGAQIIVLTSGDVLADMRNLADAIKEANNQQEVLLTIEPIRVEVL